jgi:tetratricopeptide (TPR) repeat protein
MNITYSKKKQEIRHDAFMESIVDAKTWFTKNATTVATVSLAVVFVLVVAGVYLAIRHSSLAKAEDGFGKAMAAYASGDMNKAIELFSTVADNNKSAPHGAYSAYLIGTIYLSQDKYDQAIEWLKQVPSRRDAGFVAGAALEALATAYEGKGDMANALLYNQKALSDKRVSYRHGAIRWKMALLNDQLKQYDKVQAQCQNIISDTLAAEYHSRARQLLAEVRLSGKS